MIASIPEISGKAAPFYDLLTNMRYTKVRRSGSAFVILFICTKSWIIL